MQYKMKNHMRFPCLVGEGWGGGNSATMFDTRIAALALFAGVPKEGLVSDSMPAIDPTRLDLAREFRRNPFAKHSPDLYAVLELLRGPRFNAGYLCICLEPHRSFALAIRQPDGKPPVVLSNEIHGSREDVEWAAFKRRWEAATGRALEID